MIGLKSYKILAIDMSYRGCGICDVEKSEGFVNIRSALCLKNDMMDGIGFKSLIKASENLYRNTVFEIESLMISEDYDIIVIEMPCFPQSAKSAILIGMCWGALSHIDNPLFVEPSVLKKWSGSKKGDGKLIVKEKVLERVYLDSHQQSDDNVVDAVGLALMFVDAVAKEKYEN